MEMFCIFEEHKRLPYMNRNILYAAAVLLAVSCSTSYRAADNAQGADAGEEYVNIGYGRVKKKDSASSISSIKVRRGSGYSDIYEYLKGRVSGLVVNGTSISIRGINSIMGSNEPLILVDNIEMDDISHIQPDMVERVDVLKDASSTALYGVRGANGVILITTRKSLDDK